MSHLSESSIIYGKGYSRKARKYIGFFYWKFLKKVQREFQAVIIIKVAGKQKVDERIRSYEDLYKNTGMSDS